MLNNSLLSSTSTNVFFAIIWTCLYLYSLSIFKNPQCKCFCHYQNLFSKWGRIFLIYGSRTWSIPRILEPFSLSIIKKVHFLSVEIVEIFIVPVQLRQCFAIHWMNTNISGCVCSNSYCLQIDLSGHTLHCFFSTWMMINMHCMPIASVSILVQDYPQKSKMARNSRKNKNSRGYILADRSIWTHTALFFLTWMMISIQALVFILYIHSLKTCPRSFWTDTYTYWCIFDALLCHITFISLWYINSPTHPWQVGHCVCREGWGRLSALLVIMVTLGTEVQMVGDTKESIFRMLWYLSPAFSHHMHISHV